MTSELTLKDLLAAIDQFGLSDVLLKKLYQPYRDLLRPAIYNKMDYVARNLQELKEVIKKWAEAENG